MVTMKNLSVLLVIQFSIWFGCTILPCRAVRCILVQKTEKSVRQKSASRLLWPLALLGPLPADTITAIRTPGAVNSWPLRKATLTLFSEQKHGFPYRNFDIKTLRRISLRSKKNYFETASVISSVRDLAWAAKFCRIFMKFRIDVFCQNLSSDLEYLHIFYYRQSTASFVKIGAVKGIFYLWPFRLHFSSDLDTVWYKRCSPKLV
jgi:hypothetical protein